VQDLDRQILAGLAEDRLFFLLDDLARTVVRIYDVVTDLVNDQLGLSSDLDVFERLFGFGVSSRRQWVLLFNGRSVCRTTGFWLRL
jgi:hypothetical protein